jgi:hypothetical protein
MQCFLIPFLGKMEENMRSGLYFILHSDTLGSSVGITILPAWNIFCVEKS